MEKVYAAILLTVMLSLTACANKNSAYSNTPSPLTQTETESIQNQDESHSPAASASPDDYSALDDYCALVECYIDNVTFKPIEEARIKQLSELLKGHYDITGRTAGGGLEYYLAVRRKEAPVYDDFASVDMGYLNEQFYIGYYDEESEPTVLYELNGYDLLGMPLGGGTLDCFCFGISGAPDLEEYPAFRYAFDQKGRALLDFMKARPDLSFYREGQSFVKFYYQNEDTVKFYSAPYPCYIALTEEEQEEIRRQLTASQPVDGIKNSQEAGDYLLKKGEICSTGVSLIIDGRSYRSFGNHEFSGYLTAASEDGYEFQSLIYNDDICRFMIAKVENAVGMDYGNFDPHWFQTPLKSASIVFPEYMGIDGGTSASELRKQTIGSRDKLDALSKLMDEAVREGERGFSGCPYTAVINFVREDGETLNIFIATDSCDSMSYEGRIGFEYGSQDELAAIFDEAMVKSLP